MLNIVCFCASLSTATVRGARDIDRVEASLIGRWLFALHCDCDCHIRELWLKSGVARILRHVRFNDIGQKPHKFIIKYKCIGENWIKNQKICRKTLFQYGGWNYYTLQCGTIMI